MTVEIPHQAAKGLRAQIGWYLADLGDLDDLDDGPCDIDDVELALAEFILLALMYEARAHHLTDIQRTILGNAKLRDRTSHDRTWSDVESELEKLLSRHRPDYTLESCMVALDELLDLDCSKATVVVHVVASMSSMSIERPRHYSTSCRPFTAERTTQTTTTSTSIESSPIAEACPSIPVRSSTRAILGVTISGARHPPNSSPGR